MKTALVNGLQMAYEDRGEGEVLLLVHGFPLDHSMWEFQVSHLAHKYRVLAPDLRGFGRSAMPAAPPADSASMESMAHDLAELLRQLQVTRPTVLCGLSMGGYVAWQFWQHHRPRLRGLILCDTRAGADTPEVARGRRLMADQVVRDGAQLAADSLLPRLFSDETKQRFPELVERQREVVLRTAPASIAAAQRGMADRPDMTEALAEIDIPALVLCGEHDLITPAAEMERMARMMPQAEFQVIAKAGHLAPYEQPAACNASIETFLASVDRSRRERRPR